MEISNKRRETFEGFCLHLYARRNENYKNNFPDPNFKACFDIAKKNRLFFMDEMQVKDTNEAIMMRTFFDNLWKVRVVTVVEPIDEATSNRKPDDLYKNGLQQDYFKPFVKAIKENCHVIE